MKKLQVSLARYIEFMLWRGTISGPHMTSDPNNPSSPDPRPPNWRMASQLASRHVGSPASIAQRLADLHEALIGDLEAAGYSRGEAETMVDQHLIGLRKPRRGQNQFAASPEAISLLELTERSQVEAHPPGGWVTSAQLGGEIDLDAARMNKMIARFYRKNVEQLQQTGYTPQDARAVVDDSMARLSRAKQGQRRVWHVSPAAADELRADAAQLQPHPDVPERPRWAPRWTSLLHCLVADMTRGGYSRDEVVETIQQRVAELAAEHGQSVPRPPHSSPGRER